MKLPDFGDHFKDPLAAIKKKDAFLEIMCRGENRVAVDQTAQITQPVVIEDQCYIGPSCRVGPFAYIRRGTLLVAKNHIGAHTEVKNSLFLEGANAPHLNYVGDSTIGRNCNLGAGTKIGNLRLDKKEVRVLDKSFRKFGAVLGDNVQTGINVSIYPGEFISPDSWVYNILETGARKIVKAHRKPDEGKTPL